MHNKTVTFITQLYVNIGNGERRSTNQWSIKISANQPAYRLDKFQL